MRYGTDKALRGGKYPARLEGLSPLSVRGRTGGEGAAGEKNEGSGGCQAGDLHVATSEGRPRRNRPRALVIEVERPADLLVGSSALSLASDDPHGLHDGDASKSRSMVSRVRFEPSAFIT